MNSEQQALADASCYGGLPVDTNKDQGPTELVLRVGYVLEHSSADKIPLWVCETVRAGQLSGHLTRRNAFRADPALAGAKAFPDDYTHSGYDRGHQAAAGDQTRDPLLKDQTFFMSNMAPQRPSLNRGIWKVLEDSTRGWVRRYGQAYVWTGPILCNSLSRAAVTAQRDCTSRTIGRDAVTVPLAFYKIVVVHDQLAWKAIAFMMPNVDYVCPCRLESYLTSIDAIERESGIEFMPSLPAGERRALKLAAVVMWQ